MAFYKKFAEFPIISNHFAIAPLKPGLSFLFPFPHFIIISLLFLPNSASPTATPPSPGALPSPYSSSQYHNPQYSPQSSAYYGLPAAASAHPSYYGSAAPHSPLSPAAAAAANMYPGGAGAFNVAAAAAAAAAAAQPQQQHQRTTSMPASGSAPGVATGASNGGGFYPPVFYYYPSPPVSPSSSYYSHQYQAQPTVSQGLFLVLNIQVPFLPPFLGSGLKGTMSYRVQGIFVLPPSVCLYSFQPLHRAKWPRPLT